MITLVILCFSCGMLLSKNNVSGQEGLRAMTFYNHLGNSTAKFAVQLVQSGETDQNSQFCSAEPNSSCEITVNPYYQYLVLAFIPAENSKHSLDKHGVSGFCTVTLSQVSGEYFINKLCP
jgi:DNA-directed RNA polymerase subunit N (RpoN/RPB10)